MIPKLRFTRWFPWAKRREIPRCRSPGVYVLAVTRRNLEQMPVSLADVSYVGMSRNRGGLEARWAQCHNSLHGRAGHSGGSTIYKHLGRYDRWKTKLFVAAMPIDCDPRAASAKDLIRMGWITFLEYEARALFHRLRKARPRYNKL